MLRRKVLILALDKSHLCNGWFTDLTENWHMKLFKLVAATTEMKSMAWLCLTYILLHIDENWNYLGFCDMLSWINWYGSQQICVAGYWSLSHFWYVAGISVIIFIFSCYLKEVNGSVVIQTRALNSWNTLKLFSFGTLSTNYGFFFPFWDLFYCNSVKST